MQSLEKPERFQKLVVVDSCPVFSHGAHGMVSYLRLMMQADFYKAERESDGSLPGVRAYFMDVWKDAVPVSFYFVVDSVYERVSVSFDLFYYSEPFIHVILIVFSP